MRWSIDQVRALAPDSSSLAAAGGLAGSAKWQDAGYSGQQAPTLWGLCAGSGARPYQTCVDLTAPAYTCSCPSRKFPCKHALGLMLRWAGGTVPEGGTVPDWVAEWQVARAARAQRSRVRPDGEKDPADRALAEEAARKRRAQRAARVASGLAEFEQWLDDQVRHGIAGLDRAGYAHWDRTAARLVDAQAPGVAGRVRALAGVASSGAGWERRMLEELSLLRLLASAYRRIDVLPAELAATVRSRIGFTTPAEEVLSGQPVRDHWQVVGMRDEVEERLTTRRTWLRGAGTGRPALVLSFAAPGQTLTADLLVGTSIDADLCFYPGAPALRALVATRHAPAVSCTDPMPATRVSDALEEYADALAADPWATGWPVLVRGTLLPGDPWRVVDSTGAALPLHPATPDPWPLVAAAGGRPAAVAGEYGHSGLRVLSLFNPEERAVA